MITISTYDELLEKFQNLDSAALIGVEGFCLSGKSTISNRLGEELPACVIHTDEFSEPRDNPPPYVEGIDISALYKAVRAGLKQKCVCIIEGICLRQVLDRCGLQPEIFIYVKCISENSLWHDEFHLEDFKCGEIPRDSVQEPHASDLVYHLCNLPHLHADWVFLRTETSNV